jgi:uncharacterized cofD-like protein
LDPDSPLRVVTLGGGTGLASLLGALKPEAGRAREPWNLTGIVTVSDDGGSSGRLRAELGGIPPGDLRNCLAALTQEQSVLSELLNYRFKGEGSLAGHSLGNLMLVALADITGEWVRAIRQLSGVLVTVGRLYPSTTVPVVLVAEDSQGRIIRGETSVNEALAPFRRLWLEPTDAEALPESVLALLRAELVILAPGSLHTSTLPNLLIGEIRGVLDQARAPVIYVANLMTEPGESAAMDLEAHVEALRLHGGIAPTAVLVNSTPLPEALLARYRAEGGEPILFHQPAVRGIPVFARPLLDPDAQVARHHPTLLNQALREVLAQL